MDGGLIPGAVYVGPPWPDGTPEPEACCTFQCANDECPNHTERVPCTRKYKVPGGYVCELCAEQHDENSGANEGDTDTKEK